MQKHMIDGGFFSVSMALASKVEEVAKKITMVDLGINTGPMCIMNLDKWNGLPPDIQKIFQEVMAEMPDKGKQLTIDADGLDQDLLALFETAGVADQVLGQLLALLAGLRLPRTVAAVGVNQNVRVDRDHASSP